jgi:hypothetical protein
VRRRSSRLERWSEISASADAGTLRAAFMGMKEESAHE